MFKYQESMRETVGRASLQHGSAAFTVHSRSINIFFTKDEDLQNS